MRPGSALIIPAAKLSALRAELERDGTVTFKNGSKVERVVDRHRPLGEWDERDVVYVDVTRPAGGIARFGDEDNDLRRAYAMALVGPAPKPGADAGAMAARALVKFGDEVPW